MFKIGDFSKLSRITVRMLRYYDEQGMLVPIKVDDDTGYRYYSATQLHTANKIISLRELGFSVATVKEILNKCNDAESFKNYISIRSTEIEDELKTGQERLSLLKNTLKRLEEEKKIMKYDVIFKEMPEIKLMSLRDVIPSYDKEGTLWERFMHSIAGKNVELTNPPVTLALFHDQEYKEKDVDIEIAYTVDKEYADIGEVKFRKMEPQYVAAAIVKGEYSLLTEANNQIAAWIEDNGYKLNGAMYNIYHVSPGSNPNPDSWVTEIVYPIEK